MGKAGRGRESRRGHGGPALAVISTGAWPFRHSHYGQAFSLPRAAVLARLEEELWIEGVPVMQPDVIQLVAVAVLVAIWFAADRYSRQMRRQTRRARVHRPEPVEEQRELMDASTLSASDD